MTTIINGLQNTKGIQFYNNEIASGVEGAGRARFLRHTNGKIYLIYAVSSIVPSASVQSETMQGVPYTTTYTNLQSARALYFTYSDDGGQNWAPRVALTTPTITNNAFLTWDDYPVAIQLDLTSTTSDIGIVFSRSGYYASGEEGGYIGSSVYRFTCNIYGGLTSPIDIIFNSAGIGQDTYPMDLAPYPGGYALFYMVSNTALISLNPTGFTTNDWYGSANAYQGNVSLGFTYGSIFASPYTLRVIQLVNGDYACVYTAQTVKNGSGEVISSCNDVYITFSQDNLQTWSAAQNLTSYTGMPTFNLSGIPSAVDASIDQLTDGTVSIVYNETIAPQCLGYGTTPPFINVWSNTTDTRFGGLLVDEIGGYLILSEDPISNSSFTTNGLYVYRISDGLIRNFNTGSVPNALWSNATYGTSLSTDGKYLAVQTDISIEIFNTSGGSDPLNWTLTSLRSTSTPSMHGNPANIQFVDATHLFIGWINSGIGQVYGSFLDCSNISAGLVDCLSGANNAIQGIPTRGYLQLVTPTTGYAYLVFPSGNAWYHLDITRTLSGDISHNYSTNLGAIGSVVIGSYDDVNDVHIFNGAIVTDTGNGFSIATLNSLAGEWPAGITSMLSFPGAGCLINGTANFIGGNGNVWFYYSYTLQKLVGIVAYSRDELYNLPLVQNSGAGNAQLGPAIIDPSGNWLLSTINAAGVWAVNLEQNARLRVGNFPYNSAGPALTLTGGRFYDGVNTAKIISQESYSINYPTHVRDNSNNIIVYGSEFSPYNGARPLGPFTGVIAANAELLSTQARIAHLTTTTHQARAHMVATRTPSFLLRANMVRGRAFYAQAHILPAQAKSFTAKSCILNTITVTLPGTYLIYGTKTASARYAFYVGGTQTGQGFSCCASIIQSNTVNFVGHYTVRRTGLGVVSSLPMTLVPGIIKSIGTKAYIN
jgi:hypothetical protein